MKKVLTLTLVLLAGSLVGNAQKSANVPDFREIEWGAHIDSVFIDGEKINFVKIPEATESNSYKIPKDKMKIGTVELEKLHYIFNEKDRFKKVFMQGEKDYLSDMEFILSYKFGKPSTVRNLGYVKLKEWTVGNVVFTLSAFSNKRDIFTVTIESNWEQGERYRENMKVDDF